MFNIEAKHLSNMMDFKARYAKPESANLLLYIFFYAMDVIEYTKKGYKYVTDSCKSCQQYQ